MTKLNISPPVSPAVDQFLDPRTNKKTARIKAGEFFCSSTDMNITTVLGSCIAACIRDELAGVGGMNHFMLPAGPNEKSTITQGALYGGFAMESLINELLKSGGRRDRFEIKLFGGGNVINLSSNVGCRNIEFAHSYLISEGLSLTGEDVGGECGRTLMYDPVSGKAMVKALPKVYTQTIGRQDQEYVDSLSQSVSTGSIDLF